MFRFPDKTGLPLLDLEDPRAQVAQLLSDEAADGRVTLLARLPSRWSAPGSVRPPAASGRV